MAKVSELLATSTVMTMTLASLANSTSGVGRQSTLVDNTSNLYLSAQIAIKITVGTTPTANSLIYVYLIRQNNDSTNGILADDGAGTTDAAITITNAPLLGTILVPAATSNVAYTRIFDTTFLGTLPPKWGIAVVNSSGVALNATSGNHLVSFIGYNATVA